MEEEKKDKKTFIVWIQRLVSSEEFVRVKGHFTARTSEEGGFQVAYFENLGFHYGPVMDWEPITYEELIAILSESNIEAENFIREWPSNWLEIPEYYLLKSQEILDQPILEEEYEKVDEVIQRSRKETAKSWISKLERRIELEDYNLAETYLQRLQSILLTILKG